MPPFEAPSVSNPKFDAPESDRLVADSDASCSEKILNITTAQIKSMVEPNGVTDDFGWEPVTLTGIHFPIVHQRWLSCQYPGI